MGRELIKNGGTAVSRRGTNCKRAENASCSRRLTIGGFLPVAVQRTAAGRVEEVDIRGRGIYRGWDVRKVHQQDSSVLYSGGAARGSLGQSGARIQCEYRDRGAGSNLANTPEKPAATRGSAEHN